ncbi:MAG: putative baseplate assembly protein [Bacillota bacterium]
MPNILPKIDQRDQNDLVRELRRLILQYCPEWGSLEELESDKQADALIRIFSNMVGKVTERLNQASDKNLITFLNLVGISPTPPRVSKAPLVFKLKEDSAGSGFVPAGTKVSAQPENQEEVIFETGKDLIVIKPKPVRAISIDPYQDRWSNQDFLFSLEETGKEAELFKGRLPVLHRLYLGHSKLFNYSEAVDISLDVNLDGETAEFPEVSWYYFGEDGNPRPLMHESQRDEIRFLLNDSVTFKGVKEISSKTLSGYDKNHVPKSWTTNWIYAELKSPLTDENMMPDIKDIKINLNVSSGSALYPDAALYNDLKLDLSKDFYPFGEKPEFNDTFYIALGEVFSKGNGDVSIDFELSNKDVCPHPDTGNITLDWEYWDGTEWKVFFQTTQKGSLKSTVKDTTKALTSSGTITFKCPGVKPCSINGDENYWLRARITGGNYGKEGYYKYTPKEVTIGGTTVKINEAEYIEPTFRPPSLKKLTVKYQYTIRDNPEIVVTENNFSMIERTEECLNNQKSFKPFLPCVDKVPTFYLAFDQDISNLPVSLFFPLSGNQVGQSPVVAWEYWNGRKWLTLSVNDAMRHFTRREILQFTAPSDIEKCPLFGTENYWIRARLEEGGYRVYPRINAIYSNVVWANNSNSLKGEIIGSSNGEPNQTFQLSRTPVLPEQEVMVLETLVKGDWVCWEEVKTFSLSGTDGRHYMLDRSSGIITFGDGKNGMIPPAGVDNIKCNYQHGGGSKGNVKSGSISQMWDNIPDIDSVYNPVPADGGFDQEEPEQAKIRGPYTLKSWDRGVTCEDIEWLVREAMPQISKVKCLPTMDRDLNFVPGRATVIVVPECEDSKPVPSQELLNEIDEYLQERISAVMNTQEVPLIDVIGPDYIRVGVEANVRYTLPEMGKIIEGRIIDNLKHFFDPQHGGHENVGWELGRNLYASEVYSVIKNTPGVDFVTGISIKASVQCYTLNLEMLEDGPYKPSVTYPKYSSVRTSDNTIVLALAQTIQANIGVKTLLVKGFKENDIIRLRYRNNSQNLMVVSIDGDILECRTLNGNSIDFDNYPEGSDVEADITNDLTIRSFTLNKITGQPESFFLKVATFEPKDIIYLSRNDEYVNTTPLKIHQVKREDIFLDEDELVYSGTHFINKKSELVFPYLMDKENNIVHDLSGVRPECLLEKIPIEDRRYLRKLTEAAETTRSCQYCFYADD